MSTRRRHADATAVPSNRIVRPNRNASFGDRMRNTAVLASREPDPDDTAGGTTVPPSMIGGTGASEGSGNGSPGTGGASTSDNGVMP